MQKIHFCIFHTPPLFYLIHPQKIHKVEKGRRGDKRGAVQAF